MLEEMIPYAEKSKHWKALKTLSKDSLRGRKVRFFVSNKYLNTAKFPWVSSSDYFQQQHV